MSKTEGITSTKDRVISFLQTNLQGDTITWLDALRILPLNSQICVPQIRFRLHDDTDFDVQMHVPYEGEVWVRIEKKTAIVTSLREYFSTMSDDPGLITLQWNRRRIGEHDIQNKKLGM